MKKILIILLFFLTSCKNIDKTYDDFYSQIKKYESFDKDLIYQYYESYQKTNNLINSLNLVNHPDFYNTKSSTYLYDDIILVNKNHPLPSNYIPNDLIEVKDINYIKRENEQMLINNEVLEHLTALFMDAKTNNIDLCLFSAYRSFEKQASLWHEDYSFDNMYKAVPGYSEHQTGLAVDISTSYDGLTSSKTIAFDFLEKNAYKYGFILRYPKNKEQITGYNYEPWHFRYVGDISRLIYENNLTLEEYIYNYVEIK